MASTLDPRNPRPGQPPVRKGNDVRTLGPSDSSDSGSDMAGPGLLEEDILGLDRGTNEDSEGGQLNTADAGPSVGDRDMDEDSDRSGTGVRSSAGKESRLHSGADVDVDRIVGADEAGLGGGLDEAEEARLKSDGGGRARPKKTQDR